jgi:hypothetical protein
MKIPYVAEQVVWIVQRIVEQELEALLREFEAPLTSAREPTARANGALADPPNESKSLDASIGRAGERLARAGREIEANIASRENALRGRHGAESRRVLIAQLEVWTSRKQARDRLAAAIETGRPTPEVLAELDALSREIFQGHEPPIADADR